MSRVERAHARGRKSHEKTLHPLPHPGGTAEKERVPLLSKGSKYDVRHGRGNVHDTDVLLQTNAHAKQSFRQKGPESKRDLGIRTPAAYKAGANRLHGGDSFSARAAGAASLIHSAVQAAKEKPKEEKTTIKQAVEAKRAANTIESKIVFDHKGAVVGTWTHKPQMLTEQNLSHEVYGAPVAMARKLVYNGPHLSDEQKKYHNKVIDDTIRHGRISVGRYRHTNGRYVTTITNHEPMGPLNGTNEFKPSGQFLNPGNPTLFPWLSIIAPAFDQYLFTYHSTQFNTSISTQALGKIGIAYDYETTDSLPISQQSAEFQKGCKVSVIWQDLAVKMRPAASKHSNFYFVNPGNTQTGGDVRVTTQARMQYFIVGCLQSTAGIAYTGVIGELWNTYTVHLMEPTSSVSSNPTQPSAPFIAVWGGTATVVQLPPLMGIRSQLDPGYNSQTAIVPGSNSGYVNNVTWQQSGGNVICTFYIPYTTTGTGYQAAPGSWLINALVVGTSMSGASVNVVTGVGVSKHTTTYNGFNGTAEVALTNGSSTACSFQSRVDSLGVSGAAVPSVSFQFSSSNLNSIWVCVTNLTSSASTLGDPLMQVAREENGYIVTYNRYRDWTAECMPGQLRMFEVESARVLKTATTTSNLCPDPIISSVSVTDEKKWLTTDQDRKMFDDVRGYRQNRLTDTVSGDEKKRSTSLPPISRPAVAAGSTGLSAGFGVPYSNDRALSSDEIKLLSESDWEVLYHRECLAEGYSEQEAASEVKFFKVTAPRDSLVKKAKSLIDKNVKSQK